MHNSQILRSNRLRAFARFVSGVLHAICVRERNGSTRGRKNKINAKHRHTHTHTRSSKSNASRNGSVDVRTLLLFFVPRVILSTFSLRLRNITDGTQSIRRYLMLVASSLIRSFARSPGLGDARGRRPFHFMFIAPKHKKILKFIRRMTKLVNGALYIHARRAHICNTTMDF